LELQPCKRAFHNPSLWLGLKAFLICAFFDDFEDKATSLCDVFHQHMQIAPGTLGADDRHKITMAMGKCPPRA
jgi:hypothetical protein